MSRTKKIIIGGIVVISLMTALFIITREEDEYPDYSKVDDYRMEWFEGTWECEENPLNDPDNYTGYIKLKFDDKGGFRFYDGETDKTFIKGFITLSGDRYMVLTCNNGEDEFNPPPTWDTMGPVEEMKYKIKSEDKLYITYNENRRIRSTLIFSRED